MASRTRIAPGRPASPVVTLGPVRITRRTVLESRRDDAPDPHEAKDPSQRRHRCAIERWALLASDPIALLLLFRVGSWNLLYRVRIPTSWTTGTPCTSGTARQPRCCTCAKYAVSSWPSLHPPWHRDGQYGERKLNDVAVSPTRKASFDLEICHSRFREGRPCTTTKRRLQRPASPLRPSRVCKHAHGAKTMASPFLVTCSRATAATAGLTPAPSPSATRPRFAQPRVESISTTCRAIDDLPRLTTGPSQRPRRPALSIVCGIKPGKVPP